MISHELEAAFPSGDVEVDISEPRIVVVCATAPFCFGHVVVEVDVYLLLGEFSGNGIEYLFSRQH